MPECCLNKRSDLAKPKINKVCRDITRLNFGKIKNIIDQLDQVVAATMNGLCIAYLFVSKITIRILVQLLGQDQQRVQWGSQLMRHIREEL